MLLLLLSISERMLVNCQIVPKSSIFLCVLYYYAAEYMFFKKDLVENYHEIPFNKAYLGFPNFNMIITTFLVILNLLGGHIIVIFWLYSWSFSCDDLNEDEKEPEETKVNRKRLEIYRMLSYLMIFYILSAIASFIMVQHGKLHLHFTELYAPSLVYRSAR